MKLIKLIKKFNNWFNIKFGWFFTNGMKAQHIPFKYVKNNET